MYLLKIYILYYIHNKYIMYIIKNHKGQLAIENKL